MPDNSLWPDPSELPNEVRSPASILRQQARSLAASYPELGAEITSKVQEGTTSYALNVFVAAKPALPRQIVVIRGVAEAYPVTMRAGSSQDWQRFSNESDFTDALRNYFMSDDAKGMLAALRALAREQ